ncbi:YrdB family protein [Bacillus massilinigeriensis]|uniref:YrdB family protein n=1 Tax=Bacillus massilionigeriensis TaxID=1805475 RepID=UPI00096AFA36|nr:YrdB family protein [Bacillus massilionigeriensis]
MEIIKLLNLAIRFCLELCALGIMGYWGFTTGKGTMFKILFGLGAPSIIALAWGTFGSPKAPIPFQLPWNYLLELIVFGLPVIALLFIGKSTLALYYGIIVILNRILMFVWNQ